jgi:uncharacterized membrane protein (UPF0127 family)
MAVARNITRGTSVATDLELGESFWARFRGLMGSPSIHMLFMRFPIDCVFLGREEADGSRPVVGIRRALPPWRGVVWWVRGGQGVIELPVGAIDASRTAVGDLVAIAR